LGFYLFASLATTAYTTMVEQKKQEEEFEATTKA
jgi:hypothetical protein